MSIPIVLSWATEFKQTGWTAGACNSCRTYEAVRIEDAVSAFWVYFWRASEHKVGDSYRCDFCECPVEWIASSNGVSLAEWNPRDGLSTLVEMVYPQGFSEAAPGTVEDRLRSLLSATRRAIKVDNVDVTIGTTTGLFLGFFVAAIIGVFLYANPSLAPRLDEFQRSVISIPFSVLVGTISGATFSLLRKRRQIAYTKIATATRNYKIDLTLLGSHSRDYGGVVHRAVQKATRDHCSAHRKDA